jgi:hypothetical protein
LGWQLPLCAVPASAGSGTQTWLAEQPAGSLQIFAQQLSVAQSELREWSHHSSAAQAGVQGGKATQIWVAPLQVFPSGQVPQETGIGQPSSPHSLPVHLAAWLQPTQTPLTHVASKQEVAVQTQMPAWHIGVLPEQAG